MKPLLILAILVIVYINTGEFSGDISPKLPSSGIFSAFNQSSCCNKKSECKKSQQNSEGCKNGIVLNVNNMNKASIPNSDERRDDENMGMIFIAGGIIALALAVLKRT